MYFINKRTLLNSKNKNYNNTKGLTAFVENGTCKRYFSIQTAFLLRRLALLRKKKRFSSKKAKKLRFLQRKKLKEWRSLGLNHPKKRKRRSYKKAYNLLYKKVSGRKKLLTRFAHGKIKKQNKIGSGNMRRWRRWRDIPFKFRFRRWKFYTRNLWRNRWRSGGLWISRHVLSYRMYRRIHQPYRIRKPWKKKNNSWLNRYRLTQRSRSLLSRHTRLVNRQVNFRVFSSIYGLSTMKKLVERSKHFKRIYLRKVSQKNHALNWFESRIDIMLCRLQLAPSIRIARTLINAGYVFVNHAKILNVGYRTEPWDIIEIAPHNYIHSLRYWYIRRRFQRHIFKNKGTRFNTNNQKHLDSGFGFRIRSVNNLTMPRKGIDRVNTKEFERLLLWV